MQFSGPETNASVAEDGPTLGPVGSAEAKSAGNWKTPVTNTKLPSHGQFQAVRSHRGSVKAGKNRDSEAIAPGAFSAFEPLPGHCLRRPIVSGIGTLKVEQSADENGSESSRNYIRLRPLLRVA